MEDRQFEGKSIGIMTRTKSCLALQRPKNARRKQLRKKCHLCCAIKFPSPYEWKRNITRTKSRLPVPTPENTNRTIQFQSRIPHRSQKRQLSKLQLSPKKFFFNETSVSCHNELQVDNTITILSSYVDSQSDNDHASETQDDHSNKTTDQIKPSNKTTCIYMDSQSDTVTASEAQDDNSNKTTNIQSKEAEQAIHIENNQTQLDSAIELNKSRTIEELTNLLPDVMNDQKTEVSINRF